MQRVRWLKCIARVPRRLRWRCWRWTARIQLVFIFFSFQIVQRRHGQRSRLGTRAPHLSPGRDLWLGVYATCAMAQAHTNVVARVPRRLRRPCRRSRLVMLTMLNVSGSAQTRPSQTPLHSSYALDLGRDLWLVVYAYATCAMAQVHTNVVAQVRRRVRWTCQRWTAHIQHC